MKYDVLIIGAGAAGLMAAEKVAAAGKKVMIAEAQKRIGGRIHTMLPPSFLQPVETGAEFIHGNLKLTLHLLKEAGISYSKTGGRFLRYKNGQFVTDELFEHFDELQKQLNKLKTDVSVAEFLDTYFTGSKYRGLKKSVINYVEGYYAGEPSRASTFALRDELQGSDEAQYRVTGGYTKLVDYLYNKCIKSGCKFQLEAVAKKIVWTNDEVQLYTASGDIFTAKKLLVTVPLGLLQAPETSANTISFSPAINDKIEAAKLLGFGPVIKILLQFGDAFWQEDAALKNAGFIFSNEEIPTWWTQYPQPSALLVGWCAGPVAKDLSTQSDEALFEKSIRSLVTIFNKPQKEVTDKLLNWKVCNWATDPYTNGGYTYITTGTKKAIEILRSPVADVIYFAGEAIFDGKDVGTVEAALQSGSAAATNMLTSL